MTGAFGVREVIGASTSAIDRFFQSQIANRKSQIIALLVFILTGCTPAPRLLTPAERQTIDRKLMEYPSGFVLQPYAHNLTAPAAIAFDAHGSLLVAEGLGDDDDPRIYGWRKNGTFFDIYPYGQQTPLDLLRPHFKIYGPIGGMVVYQGRVYVSHRDENGLGVITAFDYSGHHTTIVADLPSQGDFGITDLMIGETGRLYFGVGAATNSGVVGLDNWNWVRNNPKVCDHAWDRLHLRGYRFDSPNPFSGLFGPGDIAVTAPFQPFNVSNQARVPAHVKPNAAIYSCSPRGGDVRVEAHGIRYPRGLGYNGYWYFFTNDGMELRGTRPVRDDPDVLCRFFPNNAQWFGWPDFTADLQPVYEPKFQPPPEMIARNGYPDGISFVIDQPATDNDPQNPAPLGDPSARRDQLVKGTFPSLSGAAKFDFVPANNPLAKMWHDSALVALSGDRAPFATGGQNYMRYAGPYGYRVVAVNIQTKQVKEFVRNTRGGPASRLDLHTPNLLERPVDVKFGPDGSVYILDAGRMQMRDGRERYEPGSGQIFRLAPM